MTWLEAVAILTAGVGAGTINAIVGSGTLISFPVLLALGYPPVVANVSNNIGLSPGLMSSAVGYRRELAGQRARALRLGVPAVAGSVAGALLLLALPASAFRAIAPAFIGIALVLVVAQPALARWVAGRGGHGRHYRALAGGVIVAGAYGGYFGAALGVLLLGLLGVGVDDTMHRLNALRTVLASLVTAAAAVVFVIAAEIDWPVTGLIAAGSIVGGQLGARLGRRLPAAALRAVIVAVGIVAIVRLAA